MQFIKARFRTRDEFLEAYSGDLPDGGLFVATTTPLDPGAEVVLDLHCDGLPNRVQLKAVVHSWRPALPRLRIRAGAVLAFSPDERERRDFVLSALGGGVPVEHRRKHARIPARIPVRFRAPGASDERTAEIMEISIGGAMIVMSEGELPAVGADLVLSLLPPGGVAAMEIAARVLYHRPGGQVGVRFLFRDGGGTRRLTELLRRIRST